MSATTKEYAHMKKALSLALMLLALTFASSAYAGFRGEEDGVREGEFTTINLSTGLNGSKSGGTYTITADPSDVTSLVFEGTTADAFETTVDVVDPTADRTATFPNGTGSVVVHAATVVITAGATPTLTVPVGVNFIATDTITTDNQDQTITFSSGGTLGQIAFLVFQTDAAGAADEVITFQTTLTNTTGTLTLANLAAGRYTVTLQSDGTVWNEIARTAALS
jgi:hypothetical protein